MRTVNLTISGPGEAEVVLEALIQRVATKSHSMTMNGCLMLNQHTRDEISELRDLIRKAMLLVDTWNDDAPVENAQQ